MPHPTCRPGKSFVETDTDRQEGVPSPVLLAFKEPVTRNVVLLDGITRSGKLLSSKLVSNLRRVDYFMHSPVLEHIATLWRFGLLDRRSAAALLRLNIDVLVYDRMVGRNLNGRPADASYIERATDYAEYAARALAPEGPSAMETFNEAGRIALFLTHELLPLTEICFEAAPYMKMIEVVRHPVDIVHSWCRRGWGERFGIDPLAFTPVADHDGALLPWFALDFADAYPAMTPMERCAASVLVLIESGQAGADGVDTATRKRILFVSYEDIVCAPRAVVAEVARFLDTELHDNMDAVIARESLPNPVRLRDRPAKLADIRDQVSETLFERLRRAADDYERRWSRSAGGA